MHKISAKGKKVSVENIEGGREMGGKKTDLFKGVHGFGACLAFFLGAREERGEFARCPSL